MMSPRPDKIEPEKGNRNMCSIVPSDASIAPQRVPNKVIVNMDRLFIMQRLLALFLDMQILTLTDISMEMCYSNINGIHLIIERIDPG